MTWQRSGVRGRFAHCPRRGHPSDPAIKVVFLTAHNCHVQFFSRANLVFVHHNLDRCVSQLRRPLRSHCLSWATTKASLPPPPLSVRSSLETAVSPNSISPNDDSDLIHSVGLQAPRAPHSCMNSLCRTASACPLVAPSLPVQRSPFRFCKQTPFRSHAALRNAGGKVSVQF